VNADSFRIAGSTREVTVAATPIGDTDPAQQVTATIYVRRDPAAPAPPSVLDQAQLPPAQRHYLSAEEATSAFSAADADLDAVVAFAGDHGLKVLERSARKRSVRVTGTVAAMNAAFDITLRDYAHPAGRYRSHAEEVALPASLAGVVEGVLGLDNRPMARSYLRKRVASAAAAPAVAPAPAAAAAAAPAAPAAVPAPGAAAAPAAVPADTYLPPAVAKLFDFPAGDGSGECVAVFAFNGSLGSGPSAPGGYTAATLDNYFTQTVGQAAPTIVDVVVQGPGNDPGDGSNPNDSSGEVLLDLCIVGSVAPGARIAVYFTEFTEEGWVNGIKEAASDTTNSPSVISISYGNPEDDSTNGAWMAQTVTLVNDAFQQAATQGMTISCAAGDNGAYDEPGETTAYHVDFPASSPWVLGVGGTRLEADPTTGVISSEAVWNDLAEGNGATGGGVSRVFPVPTWQQGAADVPPNADGTSGPGRGVPDVASLADPETGFDVLSPNGSLGQVGGTSAAAPMWSSLIARLNQGTGTRVGFFNPQLYASYSGTMQDITSGNNGGYTAGPGWDACTGWGRPNGAKLLAALSAGSGSPAG